MICMRDHEDQVYTAGRGYLSIQSDGDHAKRGTIWSPHGMVGVFVADYPRRQVTNLQFIRDGYLHSRRWKRAWSDRTVSRLARQFVDDVVEGRV